MRKGGLFFVSIVVIAWGGVGCGPPVEVKQPNLPEEVMAGEDDQSVDVPKAHAHIESAVAALRLSLVVHF